MISKKGTELVELSSIHWMQTLNQAQANYTITAVLKIK